MNEERLHKLADKILYLRQGFVVGLGCLVGLYLFLILLSHSPTDPAWSHLSSQSLSGQVHNIGGVSGAYLADLLYTFFGLGAWLVLLWTAYETYRGYHQHRTAIVVLRLCAYLFVWVCTCVLLSAFGALSGRELYFGGIIGHELYASLVGLFGGAITVVFCAVMLSVVMWLLFERHKSYRIRKTRSQDTVTAPNQQNFQTDDGVQANKQQAGYQSHEPHHHKGALESFLAYSGLRDELLEEEATKQETAKQEALKQEVLKQEASKQATQQNTTQAQQRDSTSTALPVNSNDSTDDTRAQTPTNPIKAQNPAITRPVIMPVSMDRNAGIEVELTAQEDFDGIQNEPEPVAFSGIDLSGVQLQDRGARTYQTTPEQTTPEQAEPHHFVREATPITPIKMADGQTANADEVSANKVNFRANDNAQMDNVNTLSNATDLAKSTDEVMNAKNTAWQPTKPSSGQIDRTVHLEDLPSANVANKAMNVVADKELDNLSALANPQYNVNVSESQSAAAAQPHAKPDVQDDARFAKQSFAMQTAAYRETLSPLPSLDLLDLPDPNRKPSYTALELQQLSELLEIKLQEFRIKATVVQAIQGPVVTLFEVELAPGLKASKVSGISADLARSLSMPSCRVLEVLPGKPYIGIEVPNKKRGTVRLIELLRAEKYTDPKGLLSMAMGTDISGRPVISDLAKAPHMLVAGTTGSGKSVLMNSVMLSLLLKYTASELRLVLIDPKQVELANYSDIPHLLSPVITDMTEATSALAWCVEEMERRYKLLAAFKVRHVTELNKKINEATATGESLLDPLWRASDSVSDTVPRLKPLPFIVVIADEFADLMMQVGKQAEELIVRLAQKSRACGIHLILATQRPSADVVTGLIKSNIPARAALKVAGSRDSGIILNQTGAETMLGNGDMLFLGPEKAEISRVHGAYVSDSEVNRVCDAWRERGLPDYVDMTSQTNMDLDILTGSPRGGSGDEDALYGDAMAFVMESGKTSISALQRGIGVGYNRAANLVEALEQNGVLSSPDRSGKRTLLQGGE